MNKHNKDLYFHKNKIQKYFPKRKLTDDDYFTICCLKKNHNKHYKHKNNKFHKNQSTYINSLDKTQASTNGNQSKSNSFTIHGDVNPNNNIYINKSIKHVTIYRKVNNNNNYYYINTSNRNNNGYSYNKFTEAWKIVNNENENTVILEIYVKINHHETALFKLKRYDDLFLKVKLFCEINHIDETLIKPIIIKALQAINSIYKAMNYNLSTNDKHELFHIKDMKHLCSL